MNATVKHLRDALSFERLSILQRVFGGMFIILLLLVGLSINSWRTTTATYRQAEYVNASVAQAAAVTQFAARVGETSAKVTQYSLSENDKDLHKALATLDRLPTEIDAVTAAYKEAGSGSGAIDKLRELANAYRNSVTATIEAIKARRAASGELAGSATELSTTVAAIVEGLAHDTNDPGASDDAIRLIEDFHGSNASATRFLASRNPADSDTSRVYMDAMNRAVQALQGRNVVNRRVARFLAAMVQPLAQYEKAVNDLIVATERFARVASGREAAATALIEATDQLRFAVTEGQLGTASEMMMTVNLERRLSYLASLSAVAAGLILAFAIGKSIARPIQQITKVMRTLAYDTSDVEIPYVGYNNEIGAMADAVQIFRDNKIEADRLSHENEAQRNNREQRAKSLEILNIDFETAATALTAMLSSAAVGLKQSAETMVGKTEETDRRSSTVSSAAQRTYDSIESVANAVEELSVSIDGISESATRSSSLSTETTDGARTTDRAVQDLADNVKEIERIVSLIKQVAHQTNLLALNATIEAARAGQAGRGFAVVAGEVKALAAQTGAATEEIEGQISRIQSVTGNVVVAIHDIVSRIDEMNGIAAVVAAAVEQQRGAARIIAKNAQQALSSAVEAVRTIVSIKDASAETKVEASQVLDAAHKLMRQSDDLHDEFNRFIAGVRRV